MTRERLVRRTLEVAFVVVAASLVVGTALGQPVLFAFVQTGSMAPTLESGDGFVAVPTPLGGDVERGDIVVYPSREDGGKLTTHRVVGRTDGGFVTKGDANPFTDQQNGEPPVARDRIVATALQVDGTVVVVPYLGAVANASRDVLAAVGSVLGLGGDPGRLALFLLVTVAAALLLDRWLSASDRERDARRSTTRADGYSATALLLVGLAVVLAVATAAMVLPSGGTTFVYDAVDPNEATTGGIAAGSSSNVSVRVANDGFVPAVVFLESPGKHASMVRDTVVLEPRTAARVNVTVTAPTDPGRYEVAVVQHRYVGVLPTPLLRSLHAMTPWAAVGAVDATLAVVLGSVGRLLLGRGRLRVRRGRGVPAVLSTKRSVRRLYRNQ